MPAVALGLISLAIFLDMLLYDLVIPFLPGYARSCGISESGLGIIFGSYSVALLLATPPLGALSDRIGRRQLILCGMFGLVGANVLFLFADSFATLLAARIVQGMAGAALWSAGLALLADVFQPQDRTRALGTVMTGMSLGPLIGPPLGGVLYEWGDYRLPFWLATGLCTLAGLALLFFLYEAPRREQQVSHFGGLLRDPNNLRIAGVVMIGGTLLSLLEPTLPLHLEENLHMGEAVIGILFAVATIAYGLCSPLAGWLAGRWGRRWVMVLGLGATVLFLPLLALPNGWFGEACALIPFGAGCALLLYPTLPALADAADRQGNRAYGIAFALFSMAFTVGQTIGPILGGLLAGNLGLPLALLLVSIGTALYLPVLILARQTPAAMAGTERSLAA
jgi:multidrug resistance protein